MTDNEYLEELLPEINSVDDNDIKWCNMPIGIYLQEAKNLYTLCKEDFDKLTAIGMQQGKPDKLLRYTCALRAAQSIFELNKSEWRKAQDNWNSYKDEALEFRKELINTMKFAYRDNPDILKKIRYNTTQTRYSGIAQSLLNLSVLGRENSEELIDIGMDLSMLNRASEESARMYKLNAKTSWRTCQDNHNKVIRDKILTLLKILVDDIRTFGQFAFRHDAEHKNLYYSKYFRTKNRRYRNKTKRTDSSIIS